MQFPDDHIKFFSNVSNLVKLVYRFVQSSFCKVTEYIAKVQICQQTYTACLQSADAACDKVEFCDEHGAGVYDCTRLYQRRSKARD